MFSKDMRIEGFDDEIWNAMRGEMQRQEDHIELIASENNVSPRVLHYFLKRSIRYDRFRK